MSIFTVGPLNKGLFGAGRVVLCREVVLFLEDQTVLVLWRGCPFLGGSFIGGSTVLSQVVTAIGYLGIVWLGPSP